MSKRKMWRMTFLAFGVLTLMAIISGCQAFLPHNSTTESGQNERLQSQAVGSATPMSIDDFFAEVAKRAPAFGGLFFNEQGNLTVYLLDPAQKVVAEVAIEAVFASHRPDLSELAQSGVQVLQGQYSFSQLREWKDRLRALLTLPGVAMTDIDEGKNRLTVGVETLAVIPQVETELVQLGIPREAVNIVQAPAGQLAAKLTDTYRPIIGGSQIQYNRTIPGPTPPTKTCTLGFNANRSGVAGFAINSHCTDIYGGVESTLIGQKDLSSTSYRIGVETVDPTFFTGDPCPAGRQCRLSDSTFARLDSGVTRSLGFIARVDSQLNILSPSYRIVSEVGFPALNETLSKVGKVTGLSTGRVSSTCVDWNVTSTKTLLCQDFVNANVSVGDSGSPVFKIVNSPSTYDVHLYGILWGAFSGPTFGFSAFAWIESELDILTTCASTFGC